MLNKYRTGIVPAVATELQADAEQAVAKAAAHLRAHELQAALVADTYPSEASCELTYGDR